MKILGGKPLSLRVVREAMHQVLQQTDKRIPSMPQLPDEWYGLAKPDQEGLDGGASIADSLSCTGLSPASKGSNSNPEQAKWCFTYFRARGKQTISAVKAHPPKHIEWQYNMFVCALFCMVTVAVIICIKQAGYCKNKNKTNTITSVPLWIICNTSSTQNYLHMLRLLLRPT